MRIRGSGQTSPGKMMTQRIGGGTESAEEDNQAGSSVHPKDWRAGEPSCDAEPAFDTDMKVFWLGGD